MISLKLRGYTTGDKEIIRNCLESARDYLSNHYCECYLCYECPAIKVCKDLRRCVYFLDDEIVNEHKNR